MLDPYSHARDLGDCDQASTRIVMIREPVKPFAGVPIRIDNIHNGNTWIINPFSRQLSSYNSTYIAQNLLTYDQY